MGKHSVINSVRGVFEIPGAKAISVATVTGTFFGVGSTIAVADTHDDEVVVAAPTPVMTVDLSQGIDKTVVGEDSGWTFTVASAAVKPLSPAKNGQYVSIADPVEAARYIPTQDGSRSAKLAAIAMTGVGHRYVWGGTTPSGWDCSGFVGWVYKQVGISLPRTDSAIRAAGTVISASDAQPGDVMWWPGHVAIYMGEGMQVGAQNERLGTRYHSIRANPTYIRIP